MTTDRSHDRVLGAADPTGQSRWRPLRTLLRAMDAEIAAVYAAADVEGLKPSFVMELLRLRSRGPMTIRQLAESLGTTHSATSQKVAEMHSAGLVRTTIGKDARSKNVMLTADAHRIVDRLAAEWRATESAVVEVEEEIPYPLSRVVQDIENALMRKSLRDRIAEKLAGDPAPGESPTLPSGETAPP